MKLITIITIKLTKIIILIVIILITTIIQLIIMTIIMIMSFCLTEIKIFEDWLIALFSLRADNCSFLQGVQTCTY